MVILNPHGATKKFTPTFSSLRDDVDSPFPEYRDLLESCQYKTINDLNSNVQCTSNLLILHFNIRSLPKNYHALQLFLHNLNVKPHIILLSETWLDPSLNKSYTLDNYRLEISSQQDFRGKGAAIYINNALPYSRREDLETNKHQYQTIFVEFRTHGRTIILGTAYRSPSFPVTEFMDYFEPTLEKIIDEHKLCLFGGDFNVDILKHNFDGTCSYFVNSLASLGFFPCISLPTRITSHSATLIDNFYCNIPCFVESSNVLVDDISDHLPISISINLKVTSQKKTLPKHISFDFREIETLKLNITAKLSDFFRLSDAEMASAVLIDTLSKELSWPSA